MDLLLSAHNYKSCRGEHHTGLLAFSVNLQISNNPETMAVLPLTVRPLQAPPGSSIDFGAEIQGVDLESLTGS